MTTIAGRRELEAVELPLRASREIQGDILAGFRARLRSFLFLRFRSAEAGRAWLAELVPQVTTTADVVGYRELGAASGPAPVWINVGLTAGGLSRLRPGTADGLTTYPGFRAGPARRAVLLNDSGPNAPTRWVIGRSDQQVDALVAVAGDDARVGTTARALLEAAAGVELVLDQPAAALSGHRAGREHFGFKDCISQPGVIGFDPPDPRNPSEVAGLPGTRMVATGEFLLGYERRDGTYRPHARWMVNGSFQVFRRLAQDVAGWWAQVEALRARLPDDASIMPELLAAKMVGRWPSGTPLAHAPDDDDRPTTARRLNDFAFGPDDPDGLKTPHFSHIRRMNPRGETFEDERRRIIRRGIPFGPVFDPTGGRGHRLDAERGLLFNAFMASIEDQFEFLQRLWANSGDFPREDAGPDALIGEAVPPVAACMRRRDRPDCVLEFRRFIRTTGALYAFAPSVGALEWLAGVRADPP